MHIEYYRTQRITSGSGPEIEQGQVRFCFCVSAKQRFEWREGSLVCADGQSTWAYSTLRASNARWRWVIICDFLGFIQGLTSMGSPNAQRGSAFKQGCAAQRRAELIDMMAEFEHVFESELKSQDFNLSVDKSYNPRALPEWPCL